MASSTDQGTTTISTVHPDIIQNHILKRLDGPTLAATACASNELRALSTEERLWQEICNAKWPSINDPSISHVISTFPSGHRSFFSDSFPILDHRQPSKHNLDHSSILTTTELISCVDIYYKDVLIMSKTQEIETATGWFLCSPFRVDLLDPKESVITSVVNGGDEDEDKNESWVKELEENLTLSWIIINPSQKRAANLSSRRAVSVERHWLTGDIQVRFATIMAGDHQRSEMEFVKCEVVVTCGGGKEMHVREVRMQVEDMEGKNLNGRDSLVILQEAIENGERTKGKGMEGKERYEEFTERKRVKRERNERKEKVLDMICVTTGITIFMGFWSFMMFG